MSDIDEMLEIDLSKRLAPSRRDEIEPPGEPHGVVAEASGAVGPIGTSEPSPPSPPSSEKFSCSHVRRKKILLVGSDTAGNLNWGDVTPAQQCVGCGRIFGFGFGFDDDVDDDG